MSSGGGGHPDVNMDRADIVRLELMPGVSVELMRTWYQRQAFPRHAHEYFTVALGLQGAGVVWFRGADHLRRRGEIVVIPPDEVHTGQPAPGSAVLSYLAAHVSPPVLALCADAHGLRGGRAFDIAPSITRDPAIAAEFRRLDAAMTDALLPPSLDAGPAVAATSSIHGAACDAVTSALGLLLCRYAGHDARRADSCDQPALVRTVRQILDDCYADGERTSLAMISASCGVTTFHIVRQFTRSVGISPHRYLVQVRVRRARELLAQGVAPSLVAALTGFADQSHLTTQFRRYVGTTPASYQRCVYTSSRVPRRSGEMRQR